MSEFTDLLILSSFFLLVFAIGEIAYRFLHVKAEYTRKWSHIASGFLSLLFPYYFDSILWVGIICGTFMIVLLASKRIGQLPSINAVERKTHGSVLFPIAVFMSFCAYKFMQNELIYFYLPVLTLAICDLLAAVVGKSFPIKKIGIVKENKSLGGLLAFISSSIILNIIFIYMGFPLPVLTLLLLSFISAIVELVSPKGFDNLGIPFSVILVLYLF